MMNNGTNTSLGQLQQIDAGLLNVGYAQAGKSDGRVVILLHGWPYDIYSFVDVAPLLAQAGYRVIVPYLRGYGTTRFLSSDTLRHGQQSVLAVDSIALLDALKIERALLAGFDWGARTADIIAALWPERCKALVSVSGYLIGSQQAGKVPLPPQAELQWWYQYYFATRRNAGLVGRSLNNPIDWVVQTRPYFVRIILKGQFSLLVLIARLGGASRAEIGRASYQERSTLTRNLALLLTEGWVEEMVSDQGGRSRHLSYRRPAGNYWFRRCLRGHQRR
jgi:pimeloyl-ACP methyl ester carboxylesterase